MVHIKEQKAALVLQCWFRKIKAKRELKSKRALMLFRQMMFVKRPDFTMMSEAKLLEYAVLKVLNEDDENLLTNIVSRSHN